MGTDRLAPVMIMFLKISVVHVYATIYIVTGTLPGFWLGFGRHFGFFIIPFQRTWAITHAKCLLLVTELHIHINVSHPGSMFRLLPVCNSY